MKLEDSVRADNVIKNHVWASANKRPEQEPPLAVSRQIFDISVGILFGYYRGNISKTRYWNVFRPNAGNVI